MQIRIAAIRQETARIRSFALALADGGPFPDFAAGSHVRLKVTVDGKLEERAYSLWRDGEGQPYISVQREDNGRGGSLALHTRVQEGDCLDASEPSNAFPLIEEAQHNILIAGGIGITPILSMATELARRNASFQVHYAVRGWQDAALLRELTTVADGRLALYLDGGDSSRGVPLQAVLKQARPGCFVYVCGPGGMIDAVTQVAANNGWPPSQIRFERFTAPAGQEDDKGFKVFLAQAGVTVEVGPTDNIIDALTAAGHEPLYSCRAGSCGICVTPVLATDGDLIHRDSFLSAEQRAANDKICLCVSRTAGTHMTLDL